jgi:hypothetical protein
VPKKSAYKEFCCIIHRRLYAGVNPKVAHNENRRRRYKNDEQFRIDSLNYSRKQYLRRKENMETD